MFHMFQSRVLVRRLLPSSLAGRPGMTWQDVLDQEGNAVYEDVRLDLQFVRPGKDAPLPVEAGKMPDRFGLCFTYPDSVIRGGDRLVTVANDEGKQLIRGTFEVKAKPDEALDYDDVHHREFQVQEVAQAVAAGAAP